MYLYSSIFLTTMYQRATDFRVRACDTLLMREPYALESTNKYRVQGTSLLLLFMSADIYFLASFHLQALQ